MLAKNLLLGVLLLFQVDPTAANAFLSYSSPVVCEDLKQEPTVDVVKANCVNLGAADGTYNFTFKDKPANWANFTNNLKKAHRIVFDFRGSSIKTLEFPNLDSFVDSHLTSVSNNELATIKVVTTGKFKASVVVYGNAKLAAVEFNTGPGGMTGRWLQIVHNPQLTIINLANIQNIILDRFFNVRNNAKLTTLNTSSIVVIKAPLFRISGNAALEKVDFPVLDSLDVQGATETAGLWIEENFLLASINLNPGTSNFVATRTVIRQNKKLNDIQLPTANISVFKLRGNPLLSEIVLNYTKNRIKGYSPSESEFQVAGECLFYFSINDMAELDNCRIINSDLIFHDSVCGTIKHNVLREINGNVYLAGLDPTAVAFLSNVTINGAIRSDRCDFQLLPHDVVTSPQCSIVTVGTTTTTVPSTEPSTVTVKVLGTTTSGNSSGRGVEPAEPMRAGGKTSSKVALIGGIATVCVVLLAALVLFIICCCIPVDSGGKKGHKRKLYRKIFGGGKPSKGPNRTTSLAQKGKKPVTAKKRKMGQNEQKGQKTVTRSKTSTTTTTGTQKAFVVEKKKRTEAPKPAQPVPKASSSTGISAVDIKPKTPPALPPQLPKEPREAQPSAQRPNSVRQQASERQAQSSARRIGPEAPAQDEGQSVQGARNPEQPIVFANYAKPPRQSHNHAFLDAMHDYLDDEENYKDQISNGKFEEE